MERLTNGFDYCQSQCDFGKDRCFFQDQSKCYENNMYNKLREYEIAEEQGLLLRLPCKVGDTVWGLVNYCNDCPKFDDYCHRGCINPTHRLKEFKVDHFEIHNNGLRVSALSHYQGEGKWGETAFLTKEEAEQALEQMGE